MDEAGVAEPWQGLSGPAERKLGPEEQSQTNEQSGHGMAQRTGVVLVCARVNDLEGMQGRMAKLDTQHDKAEE